MNRWVSDTGWNVYQHSLAGVRMSTLWSNSHRSTRVTIRTEIAQSPSRRPKAKDHWEKVYAASVLLYTMVSNRCWATVHLCIQGERHE